MPEKVLFVDDDANILRGMERNLRSHYVVETASSADLALQKLKDDDQISVVVSDYRMPVINGIELLSRVASIWPDRVRVLLTGEADTRAAAAAVNQGQIYRFLMKPCPALTVEKTLSEAVKHHHFISAERSLFERTLFGSTQVLTEVLTLMQPLVFGRSNRLHRAMRQFLVSIDIPNKWEFEIAAMLSQIGLATVPIEIVNKAVRSEFLSEVEQAAFQSYPEAGARLLEKIPRLELVAQIVGAQEKPCAAIPHWQGLEETDRLTLGSHLLQLARKFDTAVRRGLSNGALSAELRTQGVHPALVKIAEGVDVSLEQCVPQVMPGSQLEPGMMLDADIFTENGLLFLAKGQWLSPTLHEGLMRYFEFRGTDEQVRVKVPKKQENAW